MAILESSTVTSFGQDNIFRSAVVCGPYRYERRTIWMSGPRLVAIGLNPPAGNDLKDSAAISILCNYARRRNFGGVVMLHLFAWKATGPAHLMSALQRGKNVIGEDNDFVSLKARINGHFGDMSIDTVVACWGKYGKRRGSDLLDFLGRDYVSSRFKCFGFENGSPVRVIHKSQTVLQEYTQ